MQGAGKWQGKRDGWKGGVPLDVFDDLAEITQGGRITPPFYQGLLDCRHTHFSAFFTP